MVSWCDSTFLTMLPQGFSDQTMQLISLIFGHHWHIFKPKDAGPDDKEYCFLILAEQVRRFGPVQLSYMEIVAPERHAALAGVIRYVKSNMSPLPFSMSADEELGKDVRDFIVKMMKFDPRDRPTAKELLQDEWFKS